MKDTRKRRQMGAFLLLLAMFLSLFAGAAAADTSPKSSANRYNVVFVMDTSGSMSKTDELKWRFDSVDLFLALASDTGNKAGAVIFNDGIVLRQDIGAVDGKAVKEAFSTKLRKAEVTGDTDIGSAILLATQILDETRDPSLPSVILLLSDGNTDFPNDATGELLKQSEENKKEAINKAREQEYLIYSICLNKNQTANVDELRDISNATGGEFVEVSTAEGLKDVFQKFYNMLYGTNTIIKEVPIPESGVVEIPFTIPKIGVEEANIIISTLSENVSYSIFRPDKKAFTNEELDAMRIQAKTFSVVKIPNPQGGDWWIEARGIPQDLIRVDMVFNTNFSIAVEKEPQKDSFLLGESVTVTARIQTSNGISDDPEVYSAYDAAFSLKNSADDKVLSTVKMQNAGTFYTAQIKLEQLGDFYGVVEVEIEELKKTSEKLFFQTGNEPPVASKTALTWKITKNPFKKGTEEYALDNLAADPENGEIRYEIGKSDYDSSVVYEEDKVLKADIKKVEDGELILRALDPQGASAEIAVTISVKDNTPIFVAVPLILLALILLFLLLIWLKGRNKGFNGDIMYIAFDNNTGMEDSPQTISPKKGKVPLFRYVSEGSGLDLRRQWFLATGSDYIYLISKDGVYTNMNPDRKSKKVRLEGDLEVTVSKNQDLESGLRITFMPFR